MHYVTRWKMHAARIWLAEGETLGELASRLGYESEAAFSRAFKRTSASRRARPVGWAAAASRARNRSYRADSGARWLATGRRRTAARG